VGYPNGSRDIFNTKNSAKLTKNLKHMAKFEFVTETNVVTQSVIYYTRKDELFMENSLSHNKEKAYDRFINISSGVKTEPIVQVLETRYSITQ
jgi:hypothetical protein